MRIFLSGAIEGVGDLANGWRNEVIRQLDRRNGDSLTELHGYDIVTPLINAEQQVFHTTNEIVRRNEMLQKSCDMILVEYNIPGRCYVGTDYELVRALDWNQPAIVWAHESYRERVYLQYLATAILPTLQEAINYITAYYPPNMRSE